MLHVHVPIMNSIAEKFGLCTIGIGVLSTCAGAYEGIAAASSTATATRARGILNWHLPN